jgi:hypothetical protein
MVLQCCCAQQSDSVALIPVVLVQQQLSTCVCVLAGLFNDVEGNVFVVTRDLEGNPGRGEVFKLGCGKACAPVRSTGGAGMLLPLQYQYSS